MAKIYSMGESITLSRKNSSKKIKEKLEKIILNNEGEKSLEFNNGGVELYEFKNSPGTLFVYDPRGIDILKYKDPSGRSHYPKMIIALSGFEKNQKYKTLDTEITELQKEFS
ncbi:MAG: hypothetical protein KC516_03265 [Nanoarchaeota archaeon]|nr:hypothetical protein [Nanoarchaeota archaeon]